MTKIINRRIRFANSGFVLPTVTMVILVVVLLSIAILLRSFNRAEVARNVRVDQATLAAATPALDRAKAKIDRLFNDSALPRSTPTDYSLYQVIGENADGRYRFGDEIALKIAFDFIDDNSIQENGSEDPDDLRLEDNEETETAWMFPVDTDNNRKYDTYTLYSILFRSPSRNNDGEFDRTRNPLEARTPPMAAVETISPQCQNAFGTTTGIVGDSDWYKNSSQLSKSFFVYTTNVPITQEQLATLDDSSYEIGKTGSSALEYQQDRLRIPLNNNAVWFEDDLELGRVSNFRLNGRVQTNGNLMTRAGFNGPITFYQVSDPQSCYYEAENAKILVGGNVANGDVNQSSAPNGENVVVHRYIQGAAPNTNANEQQNQIDETNITTNKQGGLDVAYDINAYNTEIANLVTDALDDAPADAPGKNCENCGSLPEAVQISYNQRAGEYEDNLELLEDLLVDYYRSITPRITFGGIDTVNDLGDINTDGNIAYLPTSDPDLANTDQAELLIGDRISVGYGLPAINEEEANFPGDSIEWNQPGVADQSVEDSLRKRKTQIEDIPDLGDTGRGLFWEKEAANIPEAFENSGGLRVVTGAGIYLANAPNSDDWQKENVWSDALPMALEPIAAEDSNSDGIRDDIILLDADNDGTLDPEAAQIPYLRMRATAVYHYAEEDTQEAGNPDNTAQTPFACISNYYDPTDDISALNQDGLPWNEDVDGRSNNGIVYNYVAVSESNARLTVQAELKYPNGRYVNLPLKTALETAAGDRLLQHYSAIHAAQCALHILDSPTDYSTAIPHGAIREATFLDAREVKSLNRLSTDETLPEWLEIAELENLQPNSDNPADNPTRYNLPLEQRQPLEIRVTEIDLSQLRESGATIGTGEYLLPNSGVIYASRDDALPDISAVDKDGDINDPTVEEELLSTSDFKLDPSRRPNGIRLVNGTNLSRTDANDGDVAVEKGLILVSNVPVYIKAAAETEDGIPGFNLHKKPGTETPREEFNKTLDADWGNFYTRGDEGFNTGFACRSGQPGCGDGGDQWRPATVIADSITLLSNDWEDGYRNQGDYDLRNNLGNDAAAAFLQNGFLFNNFVTTSQWADDGSDGGVWPNTVADTDPDKTEEQNYMNSYLANGITPIQRRVNFPEYLMEVCTKLPVSECTPDDWNVDPDLNLKASNVITATFDPAIHRAGTTARPADPAFQGYARRVAFFRNGNQLADNGGNAITDISDAQDLVPIGINGGIGTVGNITGGTIQRFPLTGSPPASVAGSLWFQTTSDAANPTESSNITYNATNSLFIKQMPISGGTYAPEGQPLLAPMLQIHSATGTPGTGNTPFGGTGQDKQTALQRRWLQVADDDGPNDSTFYNITFVSGNTPSRPNPSETSGGLHNFVRTLEMWGDPDIDQIPQRTINIRGNLIQSGQTKYATAPMQPADKDQNTAAGLFYELNGSGRAVYRWNNNDNGFPYRGGAFSQRSPFYWPSARSWGFDVGLLSQTPDLFAQRFTGEPVDDPNEYFREISSDDDWVRVLLCAKRQDNDQPALAGYVRPDEWCATNSYSAPE
ncbi:hypothetical protein CYANOKiyG1_56180 [Okeania sp. KiyG1]|nr:hypothetical protein CYANOKiyG1_56180 [Okeania sp. KiyG1]